ncbi:MAG: hypothetical protein WB615_05805 [Candidatus Tumulicola sp.]
MTQLELRQRGLLDLVKNRGAIPDDAYLREVACSRELAIVREIALWWRTMQLEAQCRFTARLLKRLGVLDATVTSYFNANATSSFVEELSRDFLRSLRMHADPLVQAVSQFEYAFMEVHAASAEAFEVCWDRHPNDVFVALLKGTEFPPAELGRVYRMRIARDIPNLLTCSRESVGPDERIPIWKPGKTGS